MIDIGSVHSYCRLCIKLADQYIKDYGKDVKTEKTYLVRERNKFYYKEIELMERTIEELHRKIILAFSDPKYSPVWAGHRPAFAKEGSLTIYRIHLASVKMIESLYGFAIDTDEKVMNLPQGSKLEVIFI